MCINLSSLTRAFYNCFGIEKKDGGLRLHAPQAIDNTRNIDTREVYRSIHQQDLEHDHEDFSQVHLQWMNMGNIAQDSSTCPAIQRIDFDRYHTHLSPTGTPRPEAKLCNPLQSV